MSFQKHLLITGLIASLTGAAYAAGPGEPRGPRDLDQDGEISRAEFDTWSAEMFETMDRDGDGILQEEEMPRARAREAREQARSAFGGVILARAADADRNQEVTAEEWETFRAALEIDGDGAITAESLRAALPGPSRDRGGRGGFGGRGRGSDSEGRFTGVFDQDGDGLVTFDDIDSIYASLDADGDGALTSDELPERPQHRGGRGGRGGGRGPRGF